ncbi:MAG: efflux transporter periplasmic adaptor subunit [Candidatus Cloacimonadota bacterium]|nr:MAG: efflux transporter periplasmic adaptor subunit [Candidatus Cloacimonadota bacterium]
MFNKKTILFFITVVFMISSCKSEKSQEKIIRPVKTLKTESRPSLTVHDFPGVIKAGKEAKLAFRVSGTIDSLYFREGQFVSEGQVIAKIDDRDYKLQVKATKAKYEEIKAEAERVFELYKRKSVSKSDYDKAFAGEKMAESKYQSALNQLEDTALKAPFSGYIQNIFFDAHETVNKGLPTVSMIDISFLRIETEIPTKVYLQADNFSDFYFNCEEDKSVKKALKLKSVRKKSNMNELYKMIFEIPSDSAENLVPGMVANVEIIIKNNDETKISIPVNAVFSQNNKSCAWVLKDDKVYKRNISVGDVFSDGTISVLSGLKENEIIVTAGVHTLKEGQQVKKISETSSDNVGGLL